MLIRTTRQEQRSWSLAKYIFDNVKVIVHLIKVIESTLVLPENQ